MQTGASFVGVGIVVGTLASIGVAGLLASQLELFRVTAIDPVSFSVVIALLSGVAVAASYIPARRATRVDPIEALRYE
jgi:ABC-type antimicrobial peptide transport system permease subunit